MTAGLAILDRKLLRDFARLKTQLTAIVLVMAVGVTVFVMFTGMIRSLESTRAAFYERTRFADIFASAKRVPEHEARRLRTFAGVAAVETRIRAGAVLDVPGFNEPVTVSVHSVPDHHRPRLNGLVLRSGRWVNHRRSDEVMINEAFAEAHGLRAGSMVTATLNGVRQRLRVVGVVLSPEYVYAIAPGRIIPDDKRFGVLWMARRQLEAAYDMKGAFNDVSVSLMRGAVAQDVVAAVDRVLDPYGGRGGYVRADHPSDRFLETEIDQLRTLVRIVPTIFLLVSAFLLNVVISRLVALERETIGLLKAFGYTDWQVGRHYLQLVGGVIALALVLGYGAGTWLGRELAELYIAYYRFPVLIFNAGIGPYMAAAMVAALAGGAGAWGGVRAALRLAPAEAMRPPAPLNYARAGGKALARWRFLDGTSRMVLRHLLRHPRRTALTVIGIALASGMMTGSRANIDSINKMMRTTFERAEVQDATVTFTEPTAATVRYELGHLPGVRQVDPFRGVAAVLRSGRGEKRQGVMGVSANDRLSRLIDIRGRSVTPPGDGVLLSRSLGESLGVGIGDRLAVAVTEGRRPTLSLPVRGVVETYVGTPVYMDRRVLNRALDEGETISGAHLLVDARQADALYETLKTMPGVAGVEVTGAAYRTFRETMAESIGLMINLNTAFASVIIFGVVYNAARISLSERGRELASMRVLGFTRAEVAAVMLGELAVVVALALPLGAAFGAALSYGVIQSFSQDLYRMPFALNADTVATAALLTLTAAVLSGLLVWRRIAQLDMIAVLKTRE